MSFTSFLRLIRPHQWTKNVFVFCGLFFSGQWGESEIVSGAILAFLSFCLASSAVYALNDCVDVADDKKNPLKRYRPVASGSISTTQALLISGLLTLLALGTAFFFSVQLFIITLLYLILNASYSLRLKQIVLIDVFCIALGFMLRVFGGTLGIGIPPSQWLLICTLLLSLFLGFGKRYAELLKNQEISRPVLKNYSLPFLQLVLGITASCTILSYGLYTIAERTIRIHQTENLIYSLPLVIFGLFKYLHLILTGKAGEDPAREIFSDVQIVMTLILYPLSIFIIFAFRRLS